MKGECDGRELTPGAPVSVGPGSMSGHNREGGTGMKGEQDSATRGLQMPGVVGGAQGNGTRGFSVAELTKVEEVSPARGGLQIPSVKGGAIGSVRVPPFKREGHDKGPGREDKPCVQEGKEKLTIGRIKIPIFRKDGWSTGFKRASHNITSGSLQVSSVEGQNQSSDTRTFSAARADSQSIATRVGAAVPGSVMDAKRESQSSTVEVPSMAATKRMSQDGTSLEAALEASTKKLKKDSDPSVPDIAASRNVSDGNTTDTDLVNTAASKRMSQDGATGLSGRIDVKRIRQDSLTQITGVTSMPRYSHNSVPEPVNCAVLKAPPGQSVITRTGDTRGAGTCELKGHKSGLASVNAAPAEMVSQNISKYNPQAEAVKGGEQDSATSQAEPAVKGDSDGSTAKPPLPVVRQDKDSRDMEGLKACVGEAGPQTHPTASPLLPPIKKEICDTSDREESSEVADMNQETQNKGEAQDKSVDTEKLAGPQQCSENSEEKQEGVLKDEDKNIVRECQGEGEEGRVAVGGSSCPPRVKPEMVSIETQCDDATMAADKAIKDEYAFFSEDSGEPGECLGGCEPGKKPHKCCQCDTSFRTPYELSRHGRVHSGERPYQCRLCHRCFKRKDHVEVHTRRHVEDRRHACNDCGVCFVTSSCLLRHQRRTHQAPGTKRPGEGENGEGEGEPGEIKGEVKDQISSKDAQKNGRRNKKNKPDSTYRPGGKTVCIIKKRNLRQRSYSFVELEDDVECFESDEEDRIPFLKVQEQQQVEEHDESGSQSSQLEHSLFPPSLFNPEANLSHLLLLGEVSRLLSHSLIPGGPSEGSTIPASTVGQTGHTNGPPQDADVDTDDSDCEPPLVACDVTFTEAEGEVFVSLPDDDSAPSQPEEVPDQDEQDKAAPPATAKAEPEPCHPAVKTEPGQPSPPLTPAKGGKLGSKPHCMPPATSKMAPTSPVTGKGGGTGFAAMGEPRTAWVPANNTKGKNTCDACRRRNEANRLAQMEKERQAALKQKEEAQTNPRNTPQKEIKTEEVKPADKPFVVTPPPKPPACKPQQCKPQQCKPAVNKRSRKAAITKKRRPAKAGGGGGGGGEGNGATTVPQRPHKCHLCPFNFRSATELKRHASTHSGERPFLCELCGAGFMRKCHLQLHVRRHSGERRHACQECRMRFFTPSDLARHQAIHQAGDKPLECHLCHLTFRRAFHLERHIRRHNEAAPFACKLCGAFFSSAAALRSHDKHHRTPGPHACPDCTAAFTTATALSRHRRVHSARHHRLLRAIERHATAKSSYECVSSEESPLSLVIRKVSATVVTPGESGKDTPTDSPDLADHDKEEQEEKENKDSITSGLSTTDKEMDSKVEGREMDVSTSLTNKETEQGGKTVSSLSTTDNEMKGKVEGEEITSTPSVPDKIKEDREGNITSSPSISEKIEDDREKNILSSGREKERSVASALTINTGEINEESGNITSNPSMTEKEVVSTEVSSSGCTVEESVTNSGDSLGAINLSSSTKAGKDMASHNEATGLQHMNSSRETGNQSVSREAEMVQKSASNSGTVSSRELNGKHELSVSLMSKERKEAQGRSSCSLLLPTSREIEAVKEEIHCRSTYHLATPSGGQEAALHGAPGYPGEQGGSRASGEEGGQQGGVRDGVATTS
ncbi:uncharacterized protein LOC123511286 [Portunus trituberculatus]|uniref:uncharacterized protein LOC123511286 n=1 Tax=Portunus trituberculatus TaxID=210409 RepID=UPI001E1D11FE|nr:uncharacterized protein LOC123511286 [Portunus trituberculatus]XP_045122974.1 uncharacterized protein LOC123511286 [Portunus trituberculatus]XP_045122975.1 uncharacterized protein LOC123511286 [Portunus trituberculatus]XP_045122976.1 uncharacterized protein LOC123511286 [Portunus trituberculatus]XP_045122977.1 uncharacterized protein LOC123511286 [Portunus trituberculatus]XP_045122978.1 uncharacterized protein LOC123511286 [Portunus trituberculatus]XP_045122979.1 uncharacterized protein LO